MRTVCEINKCTSCRACADICPKDAIIIVDELNKGYAQIDNNKCINCRLCEKVCQVINPVQLYKPIRWKQGWTEQSIREQSSSGGFATAIMKCFIEDGGYVASCALINGEFSFIVTKEKKWLASFSGSKYVKSNARGVYERINTLLKSGERVLFIGLPCQVAALKKYVGEEDQGKLYLIDLICHGTPSPEILKRILKEYGVELSTIKKLYFRQGSQLLLRTNVKTLVPEGVQDRYTIGFLEGIFYTENCYSCKYATVNRVGDLTLGDSWGTELKDEIGNGVSLALCQTEKGLELLNNSNLLLRSVDQNKAINSNGQLRAASIKPKQYRNFFKAVKSGKKVKKAIFQACPKRCFRQDVKAILTKVKLMRGGEVFIQSILNKKT